MLDKSGAVCSPAEGLSLSLPFACRTDLEIGHILYVRLFKKLRIFTVYVYETLPEPCINFRIEDQKSLNLSNSDFKVLFINSEDRILVGMIFFVPSRPAPRSTQPHVQEVRDFSQG